MAGNEKGRDEVGSIEVYFAKKLANNDKKVRDRAVKRMKIWLSSRNGESFSELEMMKLWKGLFYCVWFSDKPLVQEELAKSLASLIHGFKDHLAVKRFIGGFFQTMGREWNGIDALRLNKFFMFNRKFLSDIFLYLMNENWTCDAINALSESLSSGPCSLVNDKYAKGVRLFIAEIFLEELEKVCTENIPGKDAVIKMIEPFLSLCAQTKDILVFKAVEDNILKKLLPDGEEKIDILNVSCVEMADRVFKEAGKTDVLTRRRKALFRYSNMFREASKLEEVTDSVEGSDTISEKVKDKVKKKKKKRRGKEKSSKNKAKNSPSNVESTIGSQEIKETQVLNQLELENVNSSSSDDVKTKLDFDTSFALQVENVKLKKTKRTTRKLSKSLKKMEVCEEENECNTQAKVKQRKRKSKDSLSLGLESKQAKQDVSNPDDLKASDAKEKVGGDSEGAGKAVNGIQAAEVSGGVAEEASVNATAAAEEASVNTMAAIPKEKVVCDVGVNKAESKIEIPLSKEPEQKSSPAKKSRRKSLPRSVKKKRASLEYASVDADETKPPAPVAKPAIAEVSNTTVDDSPVMMVTRRKSLAKKENKKREKDMVDEMGSAKKKVIFELSRNAVTSISNLKINPATVFTPEQRPIKGVLKESSGKRKKASDFF
eukprot:gene157-769_t